MLSHLRLVVSIARGYLGYGLPHADLIQEGNVGLMKAVKRFDPERGVRLVSFAVHWIRAEIHEHILRNWRIVKIATTKAQRKLFFNLRSMKKGHGALSREETEAMASQLRGEARRTCPRWRRAWVDRTSRSSRSAKTTRTASGRSPTSPIRKRSPAASSSTRRTSACARRGWSRRWTAWTRAAAGSSRRAGCAKTDTATLHELADEFGVSAERIRQIEGAGDEEDAGADPRADCMSRNADQRNAACGRRFCL